MLASSGPVSKDIDGIPTSVQKVKLVDALSNESLNEVLLKSSNQRNFHPLDKGKN